ncbi:MAG: hypothetical protein H7067_15400 [Burkholderiales bacterium]|nr:hypothetical protein [Opitutaceae bacterium]
MLLSLPFVVQIETLPSPLAGAGLVLAGLCAGAGKLAMTQAYRDLSVAEGSLIQTLVPLGIAAGGVAFFPNRAAGPISSAACTSSAARVLPRVLTPAPRPDNKNAPR